MSPLPVALRQIATRIGTPIARSLEGHNDVWRKMVILLGAIAAAGVLPRSVGHGRPLTRKINIGMAGLDEYLRDIYHLTSKFTHQSCVVRWPHIPLSGCADILS